MSAELLFSKDHEWVRVESDGLAVIGVTDYAAEQLGDVVYVDLPAVDDEIAAGTEMGEIESTKSVSDLFSPLSGTVSRSTTPWSTARAGQLLAVRGGLAAEGRFDALPDDLLSAEDYKAFTES